METQEGYAVLTNEQYHKLPSISNTRMKIFRESRKKYRQMYIDRTLEWKQTKDQLLGSIVHAMTFEPENLAKLYCVAPKCDRRTNVGKAAWAEFVATHQGVEIVADEMWEQALRIHGALMQSKPFMAFMNVEGVYEQPLFWIDPITDMDCRCKPDKLMRSIDLLLDLKVVKDSTPDGFANAVCGWEYDCQNAFYNEGYAENFGVIPNFVFVAVGKTEPHEIGFYELDADDLAHAREINQKTMASMMACQQTNDWQGAHEKEVVKLKLKRYARNRFDYTNFEDEGE